MTNRIDDRISKLRERFRAGLNADGDPFPAWEQVDLNEQLSVDDETRVLYASVAEWGFASGRLNYQEVQHVRAAFAEPRNAKSGWNELADAAVKVTVTKVCNELLEEQDEHFGRGKNPEEPYIPDIDSN